MLGFNYRMTDLQGAVGVVQLAKMDRYIDERQQLGGLLRARARRHRRGCACRRVPAGYRHGWQSYVVRGGREESRDAAQRRHGPADAEAESTPGPARTRCTCSAITANKFGLRPDDFPVSRDSDRYSMAIPLHNRMSEDDYRHVVRALHDIG